MIYAANIRVNHRIDCLMPVSAHTNLNMSPEETCRPVRFVQMQITRDTIDQIRNASSIHNVDIGHVQLKRCG